MGTGSVLCGGSTAVYIGHGVSTPSDSGCDTVPDL
jgi:hypothetical protein